MAFTIQLFMVQNLIMQILYTFGGSSTDKKDKNLGNVFDFLTVQHFWEEILFKLYPFNSNFLLIGSHIWLYI